MIRACSGQDDVAAGMVLKIKKMGGAAAVRSAESRDWDTRLRVAVQHLRPCAFEVCSGANQMAVGYASWRK